MRKILFILLLFSLCVPHNTHAQETDVSLLDQNDTDTIDKYILFKNRLVLYGDIGFISSPFFLSFKDSNSVMHELTYRVNHGIMLGIGGSYKWIAVRLSYMILSNIENSDVYGQTKYFGLQLDLPIKRVYTEFDLFRFSGYALLNASKKVPQVTSKTMLFPETSTINLNIAAYYFFNPEFEVNSMKGRSGHYKKKVTSWYLKGNFGYTGVSNHGEPIVPEVFLSSQETNRNKSNRIGALEFGALPGIAYVNRKKNWQFSGVFGLGISIQHKFYSIDDYTRTFLGVSPRIDAKINVGYNPVNWFIMLGGELDYKQINFDDLTYRNALFNIKLTGGYRFKTKNHRTTKNKIKFSN